MDGTSKDHIVWGNLDAERQGSHVPSVPPPFLNTQLKFHFLHWVVLIPSARIWTHIFPEHGLTNQHGCCSSVLFKPFSSPLGWHLPVSPWTVAVYAHGPSLWWNIEFFTAEVQGMSIFVSFALPSKEAWAPLVFNAFFFFLNQKISTMARWPW